jgi:hypothetical protein
MLKMNLDSSDFRTGHGGGMQIETAAMEMDGDPEVVWIATATGPFPDGGNPGELSVQLHAARRMSPLQTMRESVLPTHRNV